MEITPLKPLSKYMCILFITKFNTISYLFKCVYSSAEILNQPTSTPRVVPHDLHRHSVPQQHSTSLPAETCHSSTNRECTCKQACACNHSNGAFILSKGLSSFLTKVVLSSFVKKKTLNKSSLSTKIKVFANTDPGSLFSRF